MGQFSCAPILGLVARLLLLLPLLSVFFLQPTVAQPFRCNSTAPCQALVGYVPVNATTISAVQSLFSVRDLRSLLGANNLPPSTGRNFIIRSGQAFRVPIPCICRNKTGVSNNVPIYKVKKDDGLYFIATTVFSGLLDSYQPIVDVNGIPNPDRIDVGQELWIPIPCSCDDFNGQKVVHYTHVVQEGSSVEQIARTFGTDTQALFQLNGIANDSQLFADKPFDVPLRACNSSIRSDSLDSLLLLSNGTYAVTANGCVQCKCDSANNWTLQCHPSQLNTTVWPVCPSMQCEGSEALYLGNTTLTTCSRSACTYNGFTNQTILTSLATESTCPVPSGSTPNSDASRIGSSWNILFFTLVLLCSCLLQ